MRSMVWSVYWNADASDILEAVRFGKLRQGCWRPAHGNRVWCIRADIRSTSQWQYLQRKQISLQTIECEQEKLQETLTVCSQNLRTASDDETPGKMIDQL